MNRVFPGVDPKDPTKAATLPETYAYNIWTGIWGNVRTLSSDESAQLTKSRQQTSISPSTFVSFAPPIPRFTHQHQSTTPS